MEDNQNCSTEPKFTLFPKLAPEIQVMIWKLTVPDPRIIPVKVFAAYTVYDPDYVVSAEQELDPYFLVTSEVWAYKRLVMSTNIRNSGALFACKTSREVHIKQLSACLDLESGGKQTRFDPINDTILLYLNTNRRGIPILPGVPWQLAGTPPKYSRTFSEVQKLAVSFANVLGGSSVQSVLDWLTSLPSLRTLALLSNLPERFSSLDMDGALRLRCARVAAAMEAPQLHTWIQLQDLFDKMLGVIKVPLERVNEDKGEKKKVTPEVTIMKLYNDND